MRFALVLLLLLAPQEDVDALIRRLGDENIDARDHAAAALVKLGEKARAKLQEAAASGTPEVKARAASILGSLDREAKKRAWLPPTTRITLRGEMTLKEAVEAIEKQGGRKVQCASWPDGRFKADFSEVPYWTALEAVCAASGARTLLCDPSGPTLAGEKHVPLSSTIKDVLRVHAIRVVERRSYEFDKGGEEKSFSISLSLGWECPTAPARLYVKLDSVQDDLGNEYAPSIQPNLKFTGHDVVFATKEKPLSASTLELKSGGPLKAEAKRISRISGTLTAYFRASDENISVPMPDLTDEWAPVLEVLEEGATEQVIGESCIWVVKREGKDLRVYTKFRKIDSRLFCTLGDRWQVKGEGGTEAWGWAGAQSDLDPLAPELWFDFKDAAGVVTAVRSLEVPIPKRLIRRDIPFDLKDIRIK